MNFKKISKILPKYNSSLVKENFDIIYHNNLQNACKETVEYFYSFILAIEKIADKIQYSGENYDKMKHLLNTILD